MDVLGLSGEDIITILGTGISGLAFLFVVLSYILLRKEQDREGEPREKMLTYINRFTYMTLVFAVLVAVFTLTDGGVEQSGELHPDCKEQIDRAEALLNSDQHTKESLVQLFKSTLGQCN